MDVILQSRHTLRMDRLTLGGDGLGRLGPVVVFVPYAAPGDTVEIEITEVRKRFARGRLIRVIEASPVRQNPPCPYHFRPESSVRNPESKFGTRLPAPVTGLYCGGCSWQHMNYPFQLEAKRQLVQETLERIGGVTEVDVAPVLGMADPWRYRNKVQQPVGWNGRQIVSGFFAPSSHAIVPIEDCLVQSDLSVKLMNRARDLLNRYGLRAYDEDRHTGWIRHLWVRTARDGQAILVFVSTSPDFPHERDILTALIQEFPQLIGIHQNINPARTNVILGRQWRKCWGADYLEERLGSLRYRLSPGSFFQVNTLQTEVLYNTVKSFAGTGPMLLDLYGGVGGIALWLAQQFKQVIGVDEVRAAVADAEKNAALNGIQNARFVVSQTERFISQFRQTGSLTVILDPPRAGCDPRVLKALVQRRPQRLIYVSCDPGTLARDIAFLRQGNYKVLAVQPVDLFPHTPHIETVVYLSPSRPD